MAGIANERRRQARGCRLRLQRDELSFVVAAKNDFRHSRFQPCPESVVRCVQKRGHGCMRYLGGELAARESERFVDDDGLLHVRCDRSRVLIMVLQPATQLGEVANADRDSRRANDAGTQYLRARQGQTPGGGELRFGIVTNDQHFMERQRMRVNQVRKDALLAATVRLVHGIDDHFGKMPGAVECTHLALLQTAKAGGDEKAYLAERWEDVQIAISMHRLANLDLTKCRESGSAHRLREAMVSGDPIERVNPAVAKRRVKRRLREHSVVRRSDGIEQWSEELNARLVGSGEAVVEIEDDRAHGVLARVSKPRKYYGPFRMNSIP